MIRLSVPEIEGGYPERDEGEEGQDWGNSMSLMHLIVCYRAGLEVYADLLKVLINIWGRTHHSKESGQNCFDLL